MKKIIYFLTFVTACVTATETSHQQHQFQADEIYLQRQQQIVKLYVRLQYPTVFQDIRDISNSYNIEENIDNYEKPDDAGTFVYMYKNGLLLPRGKVGCQMYLYHFQQAKLLFDMLYLAKDYDTFYKTAAWAREHVNEDIFLYAFTLAVSVRNDTRYLQIPPQYEVYPYLFVNQEVIQQAIKYYQSNTGSNDGMPYIIEANYTGYGAHDKNYLRDPEQVLSYFTEDVGLNAFNSYWFYLYPPWYDTDEYGLQLDRRGELFLYYVHQVLSRYFFERLSNDLGDIGYITKEGNLPEFNPGLSYPNGQGVPPRPANLKLQDTSEVDVHYLEELYERITSAIDFGFVYAKDGSKIPLHSEAGINVLGDLLFAFGNDNPNYRGYRTFYNILLYVAGKVTDPENRLGLAPSSLLQYPTQLRDPAYYRILNNIYEGFVYKLSENLPIVTYEDMLFPGVIVDKIEIDEFVTYFDDFYVSLNEVVGAKNVEDLQKVDVRARQRRLNHRPYNYSVTVTSEEEVNALVRVHIVPVYDSYGREYDLKARNHYSVEIDRFPYHLSAGQNVIRRNSRQSAVAASQDPDSLRTIYEKSRDALEGKAPLLVDKFDRPYGFPQRLLLPRGKRGGLPVRVIVFLEPYTPVDNGDLGDATEIESVTFFGVPYGYKYPFRSPFIFQLGGLIRNLQDTKIPNALSYDTAIYHKTLEEIDAVQHESLSRDSTVGRIAKFSSLPIPVVAPGGG